MKKCLSLIICFLMIFLTNFSSAETPGYGWWLRSPGEIQSQALTADADGSSLQSSVNHESGSIHPALWLYLLFSNDEETEQTVSRVRSVSWDRTVQIEECLESRKTEWELPAGAELISQSQGIHHYENVLDHYENIEKQRSRHVLDHYEKNYEYKDNGDGTFQLILVDKPVYRTEYYTETVQQPFYVQIPKYATKYEYTVREWMPSRTESASGNTHLAYWPEVVLGENEREGARDEKYYATVMDPAGAFVTYLLDESAWMNIFEGDAVDPVVQADNSVVIYNGQGEKIADAVIVQQGQE